MAKIKFDEPVTEAEVLDYLSQASYGYEAADNRVYSRHVRWLLEERARLAGELAALRAAPVPALPAVASEGDE